MYGERDKCKEHFGRTVCRSETTKIFRPKRVKSLSIINHAQSHEDVGGEEV
jgi:hypothetical protein